MSKKRLAVLGAMFAFGFGTVVALTWALAGPPCDMRFVFAADFAEGGPGGGSETLSDAIVAGLTDYLKTRPEINEEDLRAAISESDAVADAQSAGGGSLLFGDLPDDPQVDVLLAKDGTWVVKGGSFCTVWVDDDETRSP